MPADHTLASPTARGDAPDDATTSPEARGCILVVDDHEDNIEVLRVRLESWGYQTHASHNGEEALAYVQQSPPDLILLDVMMPDISGIDVARRIKADRALPFIPIIMQTALDSTEAKVEGLEAGADDYITKPIDFAELKARLRSMLLPPGLRSTRRPERFPIPSASLRIPQDWQSATTPLRSQSTIAPCRSPSPSGSLLFRHRSRLFFSSRPAPMFRLLRKL